MLSHVNIYDGILFKKCPSMVRKIAEGSSWKFELQIEVQSGKKMVGCNTSRQMTSTHLIKFLICLLRCLQRLLLATWNIRRILSLFVIYIFNPISDRRLTLINSGSFTRGLWAYVSRSTQGWIPSGPGALHAFSVDSLCSMSAVVMSISDSSGMAGSLGECDWGPHW